MPPADEAPRRLPRRRFEGRGRVVLITAAVVVVVLITSLRGIASFWTDYLWFDSLGQGGVFTGRLKAQATLVAMFTGRFLPIAEADPIARWAKMASRALFLELMRLRPRMPAEVTDGQ